MAPRRTRKAKGPKKVGYQLIDSTSVAGVPIYRLLRELVRAHHEHLEDARIALAWCTSWKPDVDGRVKLGMCRKSTDLDREVAEFDFIILLKQTFWYDGQITTEQRTALLDHELCHAEVKLDAQTGDVIRDERGRKVYRVRQHDLEEFSAIVGRHGLWTRDIEQFYAALNRSARGPWIPCIDCRDNRPGWTTLADNTVARCACWTNWAERNREAKAS